MTKIGRQDWRTPPWAVAFLESCIGRPFAHDAAASRENAVASSFWTEADDALKQDWSEIDGWIFCNPPFRHWRKFAHKITQCPGSPKVVLWVPAVPDSNLWFDLVRLSTTVLLFDKRIAHLDPDTGEEGLSPGGGISVFVFGGHLRRNEAHRIEGKLYEVKVNEAKTAKPEFAVYGTRPESTDPIHWEPVPDWLLRSIGRKGGIPHKDLELACAWLAKDYVCCTSDSWTELSGEVFVFLKADGAVHEFQVLLDWQNVVRKLS